MTVIEHPVRTTVQDLVAVGLHPALRLSSTTYWSEIRTVEQAMLVGAIGGTEFGAEFRGELQRTGAHVLPHRWFALIDENGGHPAALVSMCVPSGQGLDGAAFRRSHYATGLHNANPYPDFKAAIDELGALIGLKIPPNWMGRRLETPSPSGAVPVGHHRS